MTLVHLDSTPKSGVVSTSGATPLITVRLLTRTREAKHLVLHSETGEGLAWLYIFDLVHENIVSQVTDRTLAISG